MAPPGPPLWAPMMATVDTGDEVIIMEPFFECFEHNVRTAGGIPRFVPLKSKENADGTQTNDWVLDYDHLESLFNTKTKAIIVNTPHNPLGKVFTYEELSQIARLCKKWNVVCISDEVYQFLVYGSKKHVSMASLPDMWERTITVCTAGKMFAATGWKLGWAYGPSHLIANLQLIHFSSVRAGNTFLQEVGAICVEKELARLGTTESYLKSSAKDFETKRDFVYDMLSSTGLKPIKPDGGYFIVANWSPLEKHIDLSTEPDEFKDYRFTKWMTKNVGVQGIPISPFYSKEHKHIGENYVRYCFVKTDAYLDKAAQAFRNWKLQLN
ncbi:hypothetical protein Zmor_028178 [Zophobas morio]|uniref:Aminotransferase class I/classII large domain-containing protein n=1 Tax=Zophobas morio TaxID=2755281 RepID=A0AA38HRD4_9CUCU|nr:hypothetical protein Zmor_028178 [Zophobas morio]